MKPGRRCFLAAIAATAGVLCAAFLPDVLSAQTAGPPIRIIFPFAAGGSGDALARLVADKMRGALDRPVIVENRTGASGRIGVAAVKSATPDGSTLLLTPIAPLAIYQHFYPDLGYDPIADFTPVAQLANFDFGVAAAPQLGVKTLKELLAWAKANPGQANYAIPAAGSLPHFLGVMLARAAGIDLRDVPYKGSAAGLTDLMAGHIPIEITTTSDLVQAAKAGSIVMLATSDKARSPFTPDVPTLRESGYDLVATGWYGVFAPAKTPPDTVARLNKVMVEAIQMPGIKQRLLAFGLQPTGTTAEEFAAIQKADSEKWAPAVKASGFKPED
jgi:tripartite-type tricarboxylate transporter receptor subunit TctC